MQKTSLRFPADQFYTLHFQNNDFDAFFDGNRLICRAGAPLLPVYLRHTLTLKIVDLLGDNGMFADQLIYIGPDPVLIEISGSHRPGKNYKHAGHRQKQKHLQPQRRNTPPLGWVLGDEGSGTYIGRQLVGNLLKGLCDESLRQLFFEEERLDYDEIIRRVYREGMANRFLASFTRFVARHIDRPELDELVCEAFRAFVRRNLAHYPADAEVSALGGVACHFERQLRHVLANEGMRAGRIVETPDEGLLNYHIWNRSE